MAYYDYYLADRLNPTSTSQPASCWRSSASIARTQYEASKATEQDVLQADVELATTSEPRARNWPATAALAIARINTLLHSPAR